MILTGKNWWIFYIFLCSVQTYKDTNEIITQIMKFSVKGGLQGWHKIVCKIPCKNWDKALSFSRKQVFCLNIWKLWRAPTTLQFNIFCWNLAHISYLPMSTKECAGFFSFCLDLELFAKIKKTWFLHTRFLRFY